MKKEYIQPRCEVYNLRPHCMLDSSVTVSYGGDDGYFGDEVIYVE